MTITAPLVTAIASADAVAWTPTIRAIIGPSLVITMSAGSPINANVYRPANAILLLRFLPAGKMLTDLTKTSESVLKTSRFGTGCSGPFR